MSALRRVRVPVGARLAYVGTEPNVAFWEQHWGPLTAEGIRLASSGYLGNLPARVLRWLPQGERILEAGCGPGSLVLALRARGYAIEGVEWARDLVERVHSLCPEAPIRVGDVTALDVADSTYGAGLSLGVCEHREEGPEPFILELHRVLRPGGVLVISVPYFHWLRRVVFGSKPKASSGVPRPFYQFAFTAAEFQRILRAHGFEILDRAGYGSWFGLVDDFPWLEPLQRIPLLGPRIEGLLERVPFAPRSMGHMMLFVARRR